mmetsp:Transcript_14409/g.14022  ORF Transcript_14409/g.14022 Transcript_14409/m.14022 type:complete len:121 (+) Transcript_14409:2-364(+)
MEPTEEEEGAAWYNILIVCVGVLLSGFWSGLNLGILSLEVSDLNLMMLGPFMDKKEEEDAKNAKIILPLRKKTNTLLCTILLWNTMTNTLLSITFGDLLGGITGLFVTTFVIVIIGEIIP